MKQDLEILQAARVAELRTKAENLAATMTSPPPIKLPRMTRQQRRLVLWMLMRDRNRSAAMLEYLE